MQHIIGNHLSYIKFRQPRITSTSLFIMAYCYWHTYVIVDTKGVIQLFCHKRTWKQHVPISKPLMCLWGLSLAKIENNYTLLPFGCQLNIYGICVMQLIYHVDGSWRPGQCISDLALVLCFEWHTRPLTHLPTGQGRGVLMPSLTSP